MASGTAVIKVPADIEYRVIGNLFGLLIACGGLLGGMMVSHRSLAYWQEDIVPLGLAALLAFRLLRNLLTMLVASQAHPASPPSPSRVAREDLQQDQAAVGQLPESVDYTPEQVIEEVAKRIESQKANAAKQAVN